MSNILAFKEISKKSEKATNFANSSMLESMRWLYFR
jgi:hypothetical protein